MFSRSRVISSSAPNGSSISSSAGENDKRARDRDALLHPARELPGIVVSNPVSSTSSSISLIRSAALRPVPAEHLERQRDVLRARCASRRARRAGRRSRSRGRAAPAARSCRSPSPSRCVGSIEVADDAEQRRLAAARRPDQRDELARLDRQVDPLERDCLPCGNSFATPFELDDLLGARRVMRSAPAPGARRASRPRRSRGRRRSRAAR